MLRHPSNSYVLRRLNDSRLTALLQDLGRLAAAKAVRREVPSLRPTRIAQSPLGSNRIWEGVTARSACATSDCFCIILVHRSCIPAQLMCPALQYANSYGLQADPR
jgi:hypothetical protein